MEDETLQILKLNLSSMICHFIEGSSSLSPSFLAAEVHTGYSDTSFMDLESGTCDAVLGDCDVMKYIINTKYNEEDYRILETPLSLEQYGVGFAKDNTELRDQVQETLNEMYEDGTVDKIAQKYKDYGVPDGVIYP